MARIRTIKPEFFTSDTVSALPLRARLTWIGLWTHCDDYGRCRDNVKLIKAAVWPQDSISLREIEDDLDALIKHGVLFRYHANEKNYLQVTAWTEHQKVDRPSKSNLPEPPAQDTRETLASPRETLAVEGNGKEQGKEGTRAHAGERAIGEPPPPKCDQHQDNPDPPPCGRCKDARQARDTWDQQAARAKAQAQHTRAIQQAEANQLVVQECYSCDQHGYRDGRLCAHDASLGDRTNRGAAIAKASIRKPSRFEAKPRIDDPLAALDEAIALVSTPDRGDPDV